MQETFVGLLTNIPFSLIFSGFRIPGDHFPSKQLYHKETLFRIPGKVIMLFSGSVLKFFVPVNPWRLDN